MTLRNYEVPPHLRETYDRIVKYLNSPGIADELRRLFEGRLWDVERLRNARIIPRELLDEPMTI